MITLKILDTLFKNNATASVSPLKPRETDKAPGAGLVSEPQTEAGRIVAELKEQGYVISVEEEERISEFIENTEGPESEKLQAVKTALDKGLPLTVRSLESIRGALFEPVIPPEVLRTLESGSKEISGERADLLRAFAHLAEREGTETLTPAQTASLLLAAAGLSSSGDSTLETGDSSSLEDPALTWLIKALDQLAAVSESLVLSDEVPPEASLKHEPLKQNPVQTVQQKGTQQENSDIKETASLLETFAEPSDAQDLTPDSSLKTAAQLLDTAFKKQEAASPETQSQEISTEALVQGITLLMKEITPKMAAVKSEFEALRKTLVSELNSVRTALEEPVKIDKPQAAEKLSQAIDKLDKAILKSDIPLYTSMKMEKQLLSWSSELQTARSLVLEGKPEQASPIVDRIAKGIQEIQFQPAKLKAIHRVLQQAEPQTGISEKALLQRAQNQVNRVLEPLQTPREVLEAFKALGLTHESEVISALSQGNKKNKEDYLPKENLKEILMKLASESQEKLTTVTGAEKALNNLTGQQLLSRPEAKPQGQTLFFSLPMALANRVEDLKIYVQSRKNSGKVDWENCTFYFAVHTEKYGDVGIRFAAARKAVSIQVKCDNQTLRDAVAPLVADFKQTMGEAGYQIAGISYSPLKEAKTLLPKGEPLVDPETEGKGLNLKV